MPRFTPEPGQPMSSPLPYKVSTLLYAFDDADRVLLMQRRREPNAGLWSPPGGKLDMEWGESPHSCARREAREELGLEIPPGDLHLTGIVSEQAYEGNSHWLMFLFEIRTRLQCPPPECPEGCFEFFQFRQLDGLPLPQTDRDSIWPLFRRHRGGFFAAHCECQAAGGHRWRLEQGISVSRAP